MTCQRPRCQRSRGRKATDTELLTISEECHVPAILLTDQRDGSERVERLDNRGTTRGIPAWGFGRTPQVRFARVGIVR